MDKSFPNLFGEGNRNEDDEGPDSSIERVFSKHFGWIYSTVQVAEHERITLEEAWNIPTIQYLNDLAYLKMKDKLDRAQMEKLKKKP